VPKSVGLVGAAVISGPWPGGLIVAGCQLFIAELSRSYIKAAPYVAPLARRQRRCSALGAARRTPGHTSGFTDH